MNFANLLVDVSKTDLAGFLAHLAIPAPLRQELIDRRQIEGVPFGVRIVGTSAGLREGKSDQGRLTLTDPSARGEAVVQPVKVDIEVALSLGTVGKGGTEEDRVQGEVQPFDGAVVGGTSWAKRHHLDAEAGTRQVEATGE